MNKKITIVILSIILIAIVSFTIYLLATKDGKSENEVEKAIDNIFSEVKKDEEIAVMKIKDYGTIKIKFFKDAAPKAVENFIGLAKKDYYNGVTFHRVINDFMIQGGDPKGTGVGGESIFGKPFGPEYKEGYFPFKGTICMASSPNKVESLTSQFFIVQADANEAGIKSMRDEGMDPALINAYKEKGGTPHLYNQHTVFGYVFEGLDIVDKIAKTKTGEMDKPLKDVIIEKVEIKKIDE